MDRTKARYFIIGALLLWGLAFATVSAGYPKIYSPYASAVVIPIFLLLEIFRGSHGVIYLATLFIPIIFFVWSWPLLKGQVHIPKRTSILAIILILLSVVDLGMSWKYGVKYQGMVHTIAMYAFNAGFWFILLWLYWKNSKIDSFTTNFLFHWFLFAWVGWVAFPWLGELI